MPQRPYTVSPNTAFTQTNFVHSANQQKPVLLRPKPVYAAQLFTPEQEEFLKSMAPKVETTVGPVRAQ